MPRVVIDIPDWLDAIAAERATYHSDDEKMDLAIRLARANVDHDLGGPFGAVVFEIDSGRLVAVGVNSVVRLRNSAIHAEVMAIMLAQQRLGSVSLRAPGFPAHELVTSCEPCAMCLGATLYSGVRRLVTGAGRDDATAIGFDEGPVFPESYRYLAERGIVTVRGVRRREAARVLEEYRERGGPIYTG